MTRGIFLFLILILSVTSDILSPVSFEAFPRTSRSLPSLPKVASKTNTRKITRVEKTCPDNTLVYGISLLFDQSEETLAGIQLACSSSEEATVLSALATNPPNELKTSNFSSCPNNGLAVGYQLRQDYEVTEETTLNEITNIILYCDDFNNMSSLVGSAKAVGAWKPPSFCPWGEFVCGVRARFVDQNKINNVQMFCCPHPDISTLEENHGWSNYREVEGQVLKPKQNTIPKDSIYDHHYEKRFDHPYYFKWTFCPLRTYITGLQLQNGVRGISHLCSNPSTDDNTWINPSRWNKTDRISLSNQVKCQGVAIGIQVKDHSHHGIQSIRYFCSFSEKQDQLSFIEGHFQPLENSETEGQWQEPQLCRNNEAVCGFKIKRSTDNKSIIEHMKVKCCAVPATEDVCLPGDTDELIVECNGQDAVAETTCTYSQIEGITISETLTEGNRRDKEFHNSLANDWSISKGSDDRNSTSSTEGETRLDSQGKSYTGSQNTNINLSELNSLTNSNSQTNASTSSSSKVLTKGSGNSSSSGTSSDSSRGTTGSSNQGLTLGTSDSASLTSSSGTSQNRQAGSSTSDSSSSSNSNTKGVSTGHMSATVRGSSSSRSAGMSSENSQSNTQGSSDTNSKTRHSSHSFDISGSVKAEAGFNIGIASGSLSTTLSAGYSGSWSSNEGNSRSQERSKTSGTSEQVSFNRGSEQTEQNTEEKKSEVSSSQSIDINSGQRSENSFSSGSGTNQELNNIENINRENQNSQNRLNETTKHESERKTSDHSNNVDKSENEGENESKNNQTTQDLKNTMESSINQEKGISNTRNNNSDSSVQRIRNLSREKSIALNLSNSRSQNSNEKKSFTTGYDWSRSSNKIWNKAVTETVTMIVPAGVETRLYQTVGYCAFYRVRTSRYKRVDVASTTTNYGKCSN